IAFYFLLAIVFFFFGMYLAKITGAAKGQGLAGGAIVFGWGVLFGGIAFIASFFIVRYLAHKWIVRLNWLLLLIVAAAYGITHYNYLERQKEKSEEKFDPPPTTPVPTTGTAQTSPSAMLAMARIKPKAPLELFRNADLMGMGFFRPNYYENPVLYFYGNLPPGKSLLEHAPYDSITFKRNKYNQFEIATAPPWLAIEYAKPDYDLLYLKVKSASRETLEVVVNKTNHRTAYVDRRAGSFVYWPDFLLGVHSVELLPGTTQKVKVKPLDHASENNTPHEFMRPLKIQGNWIHVELWNHEYKSVGSGWVQWKRDGKLLISYNMLS
ncbi:MAG: hypothetical protein AAF489_11715, partial [Bacteroidota bacterium]